MVSVIAMEILKGIGSLFIQPLFYLFLIFSVYLGIKRVKREREHFHTRVFDVVDDVIPPLFTGIVVGAIASIVTIALGIILPFGVIALLTIISLLLCLTRQVRWLSPAITVSLTLLLAMFLPKVLGGQALEVSGLDKLTHLHIIGIASVLALFIIVEGLLIARKGHVRTSPKLLPSKRGKVVGTHEAKRLWIVPTFFLLPGGMIPEVTWWPILSLGDQSGYGLVFIPIGIGFHQLIRSNLPHVVLKRYGRMITLFGLLVAGLVVLSYYVPLAIPFVALFAILGRIMIDGMYRVKENNKPGYFSDSEQGVIILGVIPGSPAEKMGLKPGEIIAKVNGTRIIDQANFYPALQINSAFCKIEVVNTAGEIRFAQSPLYDGEHHQIGVLFVQRSHRHEQTSEII